MGFGVTLIIVGIVIAIGSFIFIAISMFRGITNLISTEEISPLEKPKADFSFANMIKNHLGGMVGMAIGFGVGAIGVVITVINALNQFMAG